MQAGLCCTILPPVFCTQEFELPSVLTFAKPALRAFIIDNRKTVASSRTSIPCSRDIRSGRAETFMHMLRGGADNRRAFYVRFLGLVQRRGECAPVIESVFMRCALKARNRARIKPCNRRILRYIPRRFCRSSYAKQRKQNNRPIC